MMKLSVKSLVDAFVGFENKCARYIADGMGNLSAGMHNIAKVMKALETNNLKTVGLRGAFELAAHGVNWVKGTTGRPCNLFQLHRQPS